MGSWGITKRESDDGLDMLGIIVGQQLKKTNFTTFNVAEAIELLRQDILEVIKKANRGCSPEDMDFYIKENFPQNFSNVALLIAECLDDYFRTGELIVYDYVGDNYDPVEHRIKKFVTTEADLRLLIEELQNVQNPEHEIYQSWIDDGTRKKWLDHIQGVYRTLNEQILHLHQKAKKKKSPCR